MTNKPTTIRLVRMAEAEFVAFQVHSAREYAAMQVASGIWVRRGARARAMMVLRTMLPQGWRTPRHHFWNVQDRPTGDRVGYLWVAEVMNSSQREAYIYDIEIDAPQRGHGYGAATLRALTGWARRRKIPVIRLRVHAHNTVARALYDKSGFAVTDVIMAMAVPKARSQGRRTAAVRGRRG